MHAFIVLGLVFPYQAKRLALGLGNGLGNVSEMTLFCVEWGDGSAQ